MSRVPCPVLTSSAKCICAPPLRTDPMDPAGIWEGLSNGTYTTWSSDHAPYNYDDPQGKHLGLAEANNPTGNKRGNAFKVPNGLPGVCTRSPLLWSEGVIKGRISRQRFVELNSSNAAKLYGWWMMEVCSWQLTGRNVSQEGNNSAWIRCGLCHLATRLSEEARHHHAVHDAPRRGLHAVRGDGDPRLAKDGHPPRRAGIRRRQQPSVEPCRGRRVHQTRLELVTVSAWTGKLECMG